jgi:hypothetical protein
MNILKVNYLYLQEVVVVVVVVVVCPPVCSMLTPECRKILVLPEKSSEAVEKIHTDVTRRRILLENGSE